MIGTKMDTDTAPVREGEELDHAALRRYLRGRIAGVEDGMEVRQFTGGRSNLTYLLRAGGTDYVLRRAPLGPLAPRAHDMVREYGLLERLHPVFPLVPEVLLLCEDASVIGAPFYLMERRHGVVVRTTMPDEFAGFADAESRVSRAFVDCLAGMHSLDVFSTGLVAIGKPEGFLERHLHGWIDRWYRAETEPLPEMDRVIARLTEEMPVSGRTSLIHNDFRVDNVMLAPHDPDRIIAVLDWEMATVGDPLVDLGLTLCYYLQRGARGEWRQPLFDNSGWFSREEFLERYARQTGFDLSHIGWYEVFGILKLAVILRQIHFRYVRGQTRDQRFRNYHLRIRALVEAAAELVGRMDGRSPVAFTTASA